MKTILDSTHVWAIDAFKREIQDILDDPTVATKDDVDFMRFELGPDLGLDAEGVIIDLATEYELARFYEIFN